MPNAARPAPYDRKAAGYDALLRWPLYHRIFWGTSIRAQSEFARAALVAAHRGPFAEVGCGSLLFTAHMYREAHHMRAVIVDRSIQVLRRAVTRLASAGVTAPNVVALHADAGALPFRPGMFPSILSLNLIHVPCDKTAIAAEFARILIPGQGRLFLSALVRCGRWSDGYAAMLHRVGELGPPLTADELCQTVAGTWGFVESMQMDGNMCFLVVRHAG